MEELEKRIRSRGTETEQQIKTRLGKASSEMNKMVEYDYIIVNDSVNKAVKSIEYIIEAEKLSVKRNIEKFKYLRNGEYK
jgi:guanylate kinase